MLIEPANLAPLVRFKNCSFPSAHPIQLGWVRVRASQLSDILKCRAVLDVDDDILPSNFAAELGTIIHKYSANKLLHNTDSDFCDTSYVKFILSLTKKCKLYGVEISMARPVKPSIGLTGSADFIGINGDECYIVDLKTGGHEVKAYNNSQLLAYAYLLLNYIDSIKKFNLIIFQDEKPKSSQVSVERVLEFGKFLKRIPLNVTYSVGKACHTCFSSTRCKLGSKYLQSLKNTLMELTPNGKIEFIKYIDSLHVLRYQLGNLKERDEDLKYYKSKSK